MSSMRTTIFCLFLLPLTSLAQNLEKGRAAANHHNFAEAIDNWAPLAAAGNKDAQYNLGRIYARGDGVQRDFHRAYSLFKAAAEQGHRGAADKLALMYKFGDGVPKDKERSKYWQRVAEGKEKAPAPAPTSTLSTVPSSAQIVATPTPLPTIVPVSHTQDSVLKPGPESGLIITPKSEEWVVKSPTPVPILTINARNGLNLVPDKDEY